MAAPTSVRVEATSISTTTLRWVYAGSNNLGIFRSTNGTDYTLIATELSTVTSYNDTDLDTGTKYWYKISDDDQATFSSVVTVYTHSCPTTLQNTAANSLPKFPTDDSITADRLNELIRRLEDGLAGVKIAPDRCITCPTDGAVVIDCTNGCNNWSVIADQDINSIAINWCEQFDGSIDFIVPPNETWGICGFPQGFGFTGDECTESPISGGPTGAVATAGWNGTGNSGGAGGTTGGPKADANKTGDRAGVGGGGQSAGAGGGGCTCIPGTKGELAIKSCNPDNSIKCATTKSLKLIACGGKGPYTWSKTGTLSISTTTGNTTTVTPAANAGSAVAGIAYRLYGKFTVSDIGTCVGGYIRAAYGCDDVESVIEACITSNCNPTDTCTSGADISNCSQMACVSSCVQHPTLTCNDGLGGGPCIMPQVSGVTTTKFCQSGCGDVTRGKLVCDRRTAGMVSNGCNPCGMSINGATVSVTDALGTIVTIVVVA